jgi:hypothetical protein
MAGASERTSHIRPVEVFPEIHQRQKCTEDPRLQIVCEVQAASGHARKPLAVFRDESQDFPLAILRSVAERRLPPHFRATCLQRERKVQNAQPLLRESLRRFILAARNLARCRHGTCGIAREDRLHPLREKSSTLPVRAANRTWCNLSLLSPSAAASGKIAQNGFDRSMQSAV